MIGEAISHYRILSKLGAGGMGEVYLAHDTKLDRKVALKILPADVAADRNRMSRFVQEAKAASTLNHPNIITIHEIEQINSVNFIATEFIDGATLRERIRKAPLTLGETLDVAIQGASALSAAHTAGIVHRDIKPENIMIRRDGIVKVLDFGLAKLTERLPPDSVDTEAPTSFKTDPGTVIGTVVYMSPEQARGLQVDTRTDIFSLGVLLYEMIAGRLPFEGSNTNEIVASILSDREVTPLDRYARGVPAELERIVAKALRKSRDERYQTAKDLMLDLKALKQNLEFEAQLSRSAPAKGEPVAVKEAAHKPPIKSTRRGKAIDSLAILPLANVSADPNMEYLSDGITESIINNLSQLPKLKVMARSTVFRYKGRDVDPQQVGCDLGVRAVLTGRVLQRGERLVIGTELVDVGDGSQLWGEQYHRGMADIFALQEEISQQISEKLRLKLSGAEKKRLTRRHTKDTQAYDLYLKGRYFWNKRTQEDANRGIECFEQALSLDPNFALAYAGLADCQTLLGDVGIQAMPPKEAFLRGQASAARALELDDTLAEAHGTMGHVSMHLFDWPKAEKELRRALALNPNYSQACLWRAYFLAFTGDSNGSIATMNRALQLDPLSLPVNRSAAELLYFAGRLDESIDQFHKSIELEVHYNAHLELARVYEHREMYDTAIAEFSKGRELSHDSAESLASLAHCYAVSGKIAEALTLLRKLIDLSELEYVSPFDLALIHSALGQTDDAFEWLERAYGIHDAWMIYITVDPRFKPLRSDPRFADIVRCVGLTP